jgi:hypothetical protein
MKDRCFLLQPQFRVSVVYVHVPGCATHMVHANRFVDTWQLNPPGYDCNLVVACNGSEPTEEVKAKFAPFSTEWFHHDDSGWDIGAYQAYSKDCADDMTVYLGGSTYLRRPGWLKAMVDAFIHFQGMGLFGSCGHMGIGDISPHIRTTGFWCSPKLMNSYPMRITHHSQRYSFEHGKLGLTSWAMANRIPARVVDFTGCREYPDWHGGPNGYHRGTQADLLVGDRMTCPPFYPHP